MNSLHQTTKYITIDGDDVIAYQSVSPKPPCAVGSYADGVFSSLMGCEGESTLSSIMPRQHGFVKRVLNL